MPITAEQVITIINYAIECSNNAKEMKKTLKQIEKDAKEMLYEKDIERLLDRVAIIRTAAEDAYRFEIDQDSLENLFSERQRFLDNAKKNKSAKNRMRILRAGYRQRKIVKRERKTEDGIVIEETYEEESGDDEERDDDYAPLTAQEINQRLSDTNASVSGDEVLDHESWLPKTKEE